MKIKDKINICGILVQVVKSQQQQVEKKLNAMSGVEVHGASEDARLVVTIEKDNQQQVVDTIDKLNTIVGVASTALVYQHSELA